MNVTLINYTAHAAELLIFTKHTRLTMSPGLLQEIHAWDPARKAHELSYMANTIPSSWEFCDYVFLVEGVSRAYTHQQVRTRTASYAQQSMRVNNMADFDYVFTEKNEANPVAMRLIQRVLDEIKDGYRKLIDLGQHTEDARGILPTNIATNLVCKFNLRTMSDLAKSRTGGRTQNEYQHVVNAMIDAVLAVHPWANEFLFGHVNRDYFQELEQWAQNNLPDLQSRAGLLKIVDGMRKNRP